MDCSKTEVFLAEWYRMCCSFDGNVHNCPVTLGCGVMQCNSCRHIAMTGGDIIDIVQEWSDSHPVKTRLSVLKEAFPNAKYCEDGQPEACAADLFGISCPIYENDYIADNECEKCWNTPIEDGGSNA